VGQGAESADGRLRQSAVGRRLRVRRRGAQPSAVHDQRRQDERRHLRRHEVPPGPLKLFGYDLVHTHFVTDGLRLPTERLREIERGFLPAVRRTGILVGIHFARPPTDPGVRIVLECQPARPDLEELQRELERVVAPIPVKPPTVMRVKTVAGS
jgi:hypothetical protein